jgi:hypothetical protein
MDFLQELGSHRGGLVRIKTQLYWYGGRGWDGVHDRVCLLMDTAPVLGSRVLAAARQAAHAAADPAALLLIDGAPHWIWVAQSDVELLS